MEQGRRKGRENLPNRGECSNFAARRNQHYNQLMNRMKRLTMMGMAVLWGCMAAQAQRDSIYKEMKEIVVTGAHEATDVRPRAPAVARLLL